MIRKYKHRNNKKKLLLAIAALLILGGVVFFVLEKTHTTSVFSSKPAPPEEQAQTTSDIPSAQPDYNGGALAEENKDPGNTERENQGSAVVTDNSGITASNTSEPKTSATGEVTVYLPLKNATLKTGQEISGTSTLSVVQYRLIDSVSGVIATGSLNVVNGNFSGTLSFSTSASEGRLDIFATRADASEYSSVEIPVRFR